MEVVAAGMADASSGPHPGFPVSDKLCTEDDVGLRAEVPGAAKVALAKLRFVRVPLLAGCFTVKRSGGCGRPIEVVRRLSCSE